MDDPIILTDCNETTSLQFEEDGTNPAFFANITNELTNSTILDDHELYQVPIGIVIVLSTFYGGISLLAVIGNGLVLWVVSVSRRMRTVTNMFIANLALADIIIGLFAIPFQFQAALLQKWNLPAFMCAFCPFVQVLSVNVSVFTLATIALDRYRAVLHPLRQRPSKRKAIWAIVTIWSMSLLIAVPTELDFRTMALCGLFQSIVCACASLPLPLRIYTSPVPSSMVAGRLEN